MSNTENSGGVFILGIDEEDDSMKDALRQAFGDEDAGELMELLNQLSGVSQKAGMIERLQENSSRMHQAFRPQAPSLEQMQAAVTVSKAFADTAERQDAIGEQVRASLLRKHNTAVEMSLKISEAIRSFGDDQDKIGAFINAITAVDARHAQEALSGIIAGIAAESRLQ